MDGLIKRGLLERRDDYGNMHVTDSCWAWTRLVPSKLCQPMLCSPCPTRTPGTDPGHARLSVTAFSHCAAIIPSVIVMGICYLEGQGHS